MWCIEVIFTQPSQGFLDKPFEASGPESRITMYVNNSDSYNSKKHLECWSIFQLYDKST